MSDTEKAIMEKIGRVIPLLSEQKKEEVLALVEGMALMVDSHAQTGAKV